jgi:CIC family chloride channel protein
MLIVLGVCAGFLAVGMMRLLERMREVTVNSRLPVWVRPILAALGLASLAHISPAVLGPGLDVVVVMLQGGLPASDLAILIGLKIVASCLCLALFFHGGVLGPSLFVGAGLGGFFAAILSLLAPYTGYTPDPGLFALAGMAAMASCVIGAPLAMILISLELGQDYGATTALVVTVVTANLLSSRLYARSALDPQLFAKGIDLSLGRESLALQTIPVTDIMTTDHLSVPSTASVGQAIDAMAAAQCGEAHLIDDDGLWAGKLCLYHLVEQDRDAACLLLMEEAPLVLSVDDHALYAQQAMEVFMGEGVPVLDQGKLRGIVHEATLFRHARMVTRSVWAHDHETGAIDLPRKIGH